MKYPEVIDWLKGLEEKEYLPSRSVVIGCLSHRRMDVQVLAAKAIARFDSSVGLQELMDWASRNTQSWKYWSEVHNALSLLSNEEKANWLKSDYFHRDGFQKRRVVVDLFIGISDSALYQALNEELWSSADAGACHANVIAISSMKNYRKSDITKAKKHWDKNVSFIAEQMTKSL
jgi:hypothetical protein